jgi:hypothetical protein
VVGEATGEIKEQLGAEVKLAEATVGQLSDRMWLSMMMWSKQRKVARCGSLEKLLGPWLDLGMRWRPRRSCAGA